MVRAQGTRRDENNMKRLSFLTGLTLSLALGAGVAVAQETTTAGTDETISLGQEVQPADGPGTVYVGDEFGDWTMRCTRAAEGPDQCNLYQLLFDDEQNAVAEITLIDFKGSEAIPLVGTIGVPLQTLLSKNLQISVDGGNPKAYPYTFCNAAGCYARVGFSEEDLARFKRGNAGQISLVPLAAPDRTVQVSFSLAGFTAGYGAMLVQNAPE